MTLYIVGMIILRILMSAVFFLGIYKIIMLVSGKVNKENKHCENRGLIVLKERFASGELNDKQFDEIKQVLGN
jgi:uncharacterized membrane protein